MPNEPIKQNDPIRLFSNGDDYEKLYWDRFVKTIFPNYEQFWIQNIVPLTDRPNSIHILSKEEVRKIGKNDQNVQIAQLHYTVLRHLIRVFEMLNKNYFSFDDLQEGFLRLCSGLDVSFELMLRYKHPSEYVAWKEYRQVASDWNNKNYYFPDFIQKVRRYRNFLTHCNLMPSMTIGGNLYIPKIGLEGNYYDWRTIASVEDATNAKSDFQYAQELLNDAWDEVVKYLNDCWRMYLIKDMLALSFTDVEKVEPPSEIIHASGNVLHIKVSGHFAGTSGTSYLPGEAKTMVMDTNAATFFDTPK